MASVWDQIEHHIRGETNTLWAECFEAIPMRPRVNKTPIPDQDRPRAQFDGQMRRKATKDSFNPSPLSNRGLQFTDLSTRQPRVEYRHCDLPYELRQGDEIVRLDEGVRYEVSDVQYDGYSVVTLYLLEKGKGGHAP